MKLKYTVLEAGLVLVAVCAATGMARTVSLRSPAGEMPARTFNLLDDEAKLFKSNLPSGAISGNGVRMARPKAAAVPPAQGFNVRLQGCNLKPSGNDETTIVNFRASSPEMTAVVNGDEFRANGGGCYVGNDYYYVGYSQFFGMVLPALYHYDTTTWESLGVRDLDEGCISYDMTYDATDGKIYGAFYNDDMNGYVFGTFDPETLVRTEIAALPCEYFAIAASPQGVIYGIDEDGILNILDKNTGAITEVGATGVIPDFKQSADFDATSGKLYWAASHQDGSSALYEVDVTGGQAVKIYDFADNEQITALHVLPPEAADDAPTVVDNLALAFDNGALSGTVSFTAPSYCYGGSSLSGSLTYSVKIDGEQVGSGATSPGSDVEVSASVPEAGMHTVTVTTANAAGQSPEVSKSQWFGMDSPAPVKNIQVTTDDDNVIVSWEAPDAGINGGFINKAGLRYTVVRYPEGVTVADRQSGTSFTEPYSKEGLKSYSYEITAHYGELSSPAASSGKTLIGGAFPVPYTENFNTPDALDMFTVIDVHGDEKMWELNYDEEDMVGDVRCKYSSSNPKDDWLISPPVRLEAGKLYNVSLDILARGGFRYPEKLEVILGSAASVAGMTDGKVAVIIPEAEYDVKTFAEFSGLVQVEADGDYYIGIHACSDTYMDVLGVDNLSVAEESDTSAPAAVTEFTVTPDEKGALGATLSFKAPAVTIAGDELSAVTSIGIYKGEALLHTIGAVSPGELTTWHDDAPAEGVNEYTVRAFNGDARGLAVKASAFVGFDVPGLPTNVRISEADGVVTLTWNAPSKGAFGGYIDPATLKYMVSDSESEVIKSDITGNEYRFMPVIKGQDLFAWSVAAVNDKGMGNSARSNILALGTPYPMPFKESFPEAYNETSPWGQYLSGEGGRWFTSAVGLSPVTTPQDNDGGLLTFIPESDNDEALIYSGKIDVSAASAPVVDFWYYGSDAAVASLALEVSAKHGEFTPLFTADYSQASPGWNLARVPLTGVDCSDYIQFGLRGRSGSVGAHLHVDNLVVRDPLAHDLAAVSVVAPSALKVGRESTVTVQLVNIGREKAEGYSVQLWANGAYLQSVDGKALEALELAAYDFAVTPTVSMSKSVSFGVKIVYAADGNLADNTLIGGYSPVEMPVYPVVNDLRGSYAEGNVNLEWTPLDDCVMDPEPTVEDFEGMDEFTIDNFGEWTVVDVDGGPGTYSPNNSAGVAMSYPNAGKPMAFQVLNPSHAGFLLVNGDGYPTGWMPHSGDQVLAAFGDVDGQNNDWLISPELSGDAQTVTFYARSYNDMYGLETLEVLTSTSDKELDSFERVKGIASQVPAAWTKYTVNIPEGTKYFAIRCTSRNAFVLLIDDISFTPAGAMPVELKLEGYNVYRDGVKISDTPVKDASFAEPFQSGKLPKYAVTAVYDKGESNLSNIVSVLTVGLNGVTAADTQLSVVPVAAGLEIKAPAGAAVTVTRADGATLWQGMANGDTFFVGVQPGVYVVSGADSAVKAVVR